MRALHHLLAALWPPVPAEVRDELALLRYDRLQRTIPLLYVTMVAVIVGAMAAADERAPFLVAYGIPMLVILSAVARFAVWLRGRGQTVGAAEAQTRIRRMMLVSGVIAALCSGWCVSGYLLSEPGARAYYILFMAMGSLSTAFCLSSVRLATITNLAVGLVPCSLAMAASFNRIDVIAALVVICAGAFLVRMILQQHDQLVALLVLKQRLRVEANSDPLTGLANRRALMETMALAAGPASAVAIIDLDGFKPVNDGHGHAAGDRMLIEVARRMQGAVDSAGLVARLGGDEFALFVGDGGVPIETLVDRMLAALARPIDIGRQRIAIGASAGIARAGGKRRDADSLLAEADARLYKAKAMRAGGAGARHRPVSRSGMRG